jgi:hypothetical protein
MQSFTLSAEHLSPEQKALLKSLLKTIAGQARDGWRIQEGNESADAMIVGSDSISGRRTLHKLRSQEYPVPVALGREADLSHHVLMFKQPFQSRQIVATLDAIATLVTSIRAAGLQTNRPSGLRTDALGTNPRAPISSVIELAFTLRGLVQSSKTVSPVKVTLGEMGTLYLVPAKKTFRTALDVSAIGMLAARVPVSCEPVAKVDFHFEDLACLEQPWSSLLWAVGTHHAPGKLFPWVDPHAHFSLNELPALGTYHFTAVEIKMITALRNGSMQKDALARVAGTELNDAIQFINAASLVGSLNQTTVKANIEIVQKKSASVSTGTRLVARLDAA